MTNRKYEAARNALIRQAERYATEQAGYRQYGTDGENETWARKWNLAFHQRMDELARGAGLVDEESTP
jgi:hypothetical protein